MEAVALLNGLDIVLNIIIALDIFIAPLAMWHALLYKRDPRAAMGWISVCLLFPLVGPVLYFFFGINRVHHRAIAWQKGGHRRRFIEFERGNQPLSEIPCYGKIDDQFSPHIRATYALTGQALLAGNCVTALHNGEEAFPAMLAAIAEAETTIELSVYIFESNRSGQCFAEALCAAVARGVDVKVIIDGMGELYSWPKISRRLRRCGVRVARFNRPRLIGLLPGLNLRNHRKILVIDNVVGFSGGINIGDRYLVEGVKSKRATADIHFQFRGPVVGQLKEGFSHTWQLATGEKLKVTKSGCEELGLSACRVIVDGPDLNLDKLEHVYLSAIAQANQSIGIMTPYFLPSRAMLAALQTAALRGVAITIILPEKNNLAYVHWATRNMLWELLYYHIKVVYQPLPFNHSKLFMVDSEYVLLGSANLDPRSLRLNYELNVEVYDRSLAEGLEQAFYAVEARSRVLCLAELDARSYLVRTRDAFCWLFSPYL